MMLFLILVGCFQPVFKLDDSLACDEDIFSWTGGLTYHVLQDQKNTGIFDYQPGGDLENRISGYYDLQTGYFEWEVEYVDGYYKTSEAVSGAGYLWTDGDMDVEAEGTVSYIDGSKGQYSLREERWGCETRARTTWGDDETYLVTGLYENGAHSYTREWYAKNRAYLAEGVASSDYSYNESLFYKKDSYKLEYDENGDSGGYRKRDFLEKWIQRKEGVLEEYADGRQHWNYVVTDGDREEHWDYTTDFSGNGEGTLIWGNSDQKSCTLKFTEGECKKKQCTSGDNGACW